MAVGSAGTRERVGRCPDPLRAAFDGRTGQWKPERVLRKLRNGHLRAGPLQAHPQTG